MATLCWTHGGTTICCHHELNVDYRVLTRSGPSEHGYLSFLDSFSFYNNVFMVFKIGHNQVFTCICTYTHTYIDAYIHMYTLRLIHWYLYMYTYIQACISTYMHKGSSGQWKSEGLKLDDHQGQNYLVLKFLLLVRPLSNWGVVSTLTLHYRWDHTTH